VRRFNLSEWALANRPLVLFAMLAFALIGAWSYKHLGQSEDPPFTFKAMVVRTLWPGATAEQVSRQVTEPIEKALMNTGEYEFIRSYSRPGESQVIFMARDSLRSRQIPTCGTRCASGGRHPATLPREIVGPFFNDEFGDTYGNIYALTGKGFDYAVMRTTPTASSWSCSACPTSARSTWSACRTRRSGSSCPTPAWPRWACRCSRCSRRWPTRTRSPAPASSRPPPTACSCA
jgi:multidrug efflux pump